MELAASSLCPGKLRANSSSPGAVWLHEKSSKWAVFSLCNPSSGMWVRILLHKQGVKLQEGVFRSGWSSICGAATSLPAEGPTDSTYGHGFGHCSCFASCPTAAVFLPYHMP